jgi:hypothetical protein
MNKTTPFAAAIVATVLFAGHAMADSVSTTTIESEQPETSVKKTTYTETESTPVTTERVEKTRVETQSNPSVSKSTTVKTKTKVKPVKSSYSAEIKIK